MRKTTITFVPLSVALTLICSVLLLFVAFEPTITNGQSPEFTISQQITGESSFLVDPTDVTMSGSIAGITGGQATGESQFVVQTNNVNGYTIDISFENNGFGEAMVSPTNDNAIQDYAAGTTEPSRDYVTATFAQFAYTVRSSTTADTDQSFFQDGTNCNASGGDQDVTCWKAPSFSNFQIVDRGAAAPDGATTTIFFDVTVPSGASPAPNAETYTATATLSLTPTP
jgi:hypothetical protein